MRKMIVVAVIGLVAGCADPKETVYARDDGSHGSQLQLDRDTARCRNEGMAMAGINPYVYAGTAYENCMVSAGWRVTERRY